MFEKIRIWIKARKKANRIMTEQYLAEELIGKIEKALEIELYDWQRLYLITGIWQPPGARRQGRTLAYILRLLLDNSQPLLLRRPGEVDAYAERPNDGWRYKTVPTHYAKWFRSELKEIYERLRDAGVPVREVVFYNDKPW